MCLKIDPLNLLAPGWRPVTVKEVGNNAYRSKDTTMSQELVPQSLGQQVELAKVMAEASLLPKQYQKQPGNLLYAIKYAESLNLSIIDAITGIHVIEGKPSASANLIAALVRRAGHRLRVTGTDTEATASIVRCDDPDFTFTCTWTIERAKAAGLTNKSVWKSYPAAMLKARAITEVAREAASEALCGAIYTPEELGQDGSVSDAGEFVPVSVTLDGPTAFEPPVPAGMESRLDAVRRVIAAAPSPADAQAAWSAAGLPGKDDGVLFVNSHEVDVLVEAFGITDAEIVEDEDDAVTPSVLDSKTRAGMFAALTKAGVTGDDEQKAFIEAAIGRTVSSRAAISHPEADLVKAAAKAHIPSNYAGQDPWDLAEGEVA